MNRGVVIFIGVIFLIFLGFLLILTGGNGKKPANNEHTVMALPDYADTDATVSATTDGIVNGDEMHRQIKITVGSEQRELDIIQGYSGHVLTSQTFYNTPDAYSVFLRSINNSGFLLARKKNAKIPANPAGECPLGNRYIFNLSQEGDTLSNLWASDCGNSMGTLGGSSTTLQTLFQRQIPNYNTLVQNVNLSATTTQ